MEHSQSKPTSSKRWLAVAGLLLAAVLIGLAVWRLTAAGPVPDDIQSAGGSGAYQPDTSKLPAGYTFDNSSIHQADDGVTILTIKGNSGNSVSISQQAQPGKEVIDNFTKTYIPLHTALGTGLGEAQIGASGQSSSLQTIVSLPVKDGPWLIITAPADVSQDDLKQIIESLKT